MLTFSIDIGRTVGQIAEDTYDEGHDHDHLLRLRRDTRRQYLKLCEHVNEKNPHFWEGLATGKPASACVERTLGPGSIDEADLVLHHCRRLWEESEDALVMMEADTAKYIRVYKPPPMKKLQSSLLGMGSVKPVYDPKEAVELLNGPNPPSMIFITDAVITRHREVLERIIDVMHMGAKVVAGGSFAMATTGELARFFTIIGLPWERGDYCMSTVELQSGVQDDDLTDLLPREIFDKTCFIKGVKKSDGWYTDPIAKVQTAVAYTAIGAGRFGYIGFINNERGPIDVVRVMLGLPLELQTGL